MEVDGGKSLDLSNYPYIFMVMYSLSFDQLVKMTPCIIINSLPFSVILTSRDGKSNILSMLEQTVD